VQGEEDEEKNEEENEKNEEKKERRKERRWINCDWKRTKHFKQGI